ncbi:hypothetical protein DITRI_Ditri03aG0053700 [Diplodiscus trichospermus]
MEEEEGRKRASKETSDVSGSTEPLSLKQKREMEADELNDDFMAWLSMEGEEGSEADSMSELLKLLEDSADASTSGSSSTSSPTSFGTRVRFSDNPYLSALVFQSSSSYITINGNEESCGSSFSDSECSVMASVDMGWILSTNVKAGSNFEGIRGWLEAEERGAWGKSDEEARKWMMDWEWYEERPTSFLGHEEYPF